MLSIVVIFDSAHANDEIKSPTKTKTKDKGKKVQHLPHQQLHITPMLLWISQLQIGHRK